MQEECNRRMEDLSKAERSLAEVGPSSDPSAVISLARELRGLHQYFSEGEARRLLERRQAERGEGGYSHPRFVRIRDFCTHVLDSSAGPDSLREELRSGKLIGGVSLSDADKAGFRQTLRGLKTLSELAERMQSGEPSLEDARKLSDLLRQFHSDFQNDRKARRILEAFFRRRGIPNPEEYAHRQFEAIQKFYSLIEGKSDSEILSLMKTAEFRAAFSAAFKAFSLLSKETKACLEYAVGLSGGGTSTSSRVEQPEPVSLVPPPASMAGSEGGTPCPPQPAPQTQPILPSSSSSASVAKQVTQALTEMATAAARRADKIEKELEYRTVPQERKRAEIAAIVRRIAASHPEAKLELKVPDTKFMSEADVNAMLIQYRDMEASLMAGGRGNGTVRRS